MSSALPEGWEYSQIGNKFILNTSSILPNSNPLQKYAYYSLPSFDERGTYVATFGEEIDSNKFKINIPSILVSKLNPRKPRVMLVKPQDFETCCSTEFMCYEPKTIVSVNLEYFKHYFSSEAFHSMLELVATGSTNSHVRVSPTETLRWKIPIPPLIEQEKIAAVLGAVDDVIEKTALQIKKLNDLKKSTMNELLTKGIGHTDFKPSELGQIPKSWEVKTIGETSIIIEDGDRGSNYPKEQDFTPSGYCLFLSAKNVTKSGFRFDERVFISKLKHEQLRKGWVKRNDIVITTRGTVGNIAYFDDDISFPVMRINSGMALIRNTDPKIYTPFLYLFLSSELAKLQIDSLTFGSAQPQLTIGVINSLILPIPTFEEQKELVRIAGALKENYEKKQEKLNSLNALKKSLMQDLLSGKVRVMV